MKWRIEVLSSSRYEELTDCCEYVFLFEEYVLLSIPTCYEDFTPEDLNGWSVVMCNVEVLRY